MTPVLSLHVLSPASCWDRVIGAGRFANAGASDSRFVRFAAIVGSRRGY
jgi:hypothetical protein